MKKWVVLFLVTLILCIGGYVVNPKPMYITYLNERYFGDAQAEVLMSKSGKKLRLLLTSLFISRL